jgi:hypothetical protein
MSEAQEISTSIYNYHLNKENVKKKKKKLAKDATGQNTKPSTALSTN